MNSPARPRFQNPFRDEALIQHVEICPVCAHGTATLVSEYNRFVTVEGIDESFFRYDYSLCHACGVVYARLRPYGPRHQFLLDNFNETLGRSNDPATGNMILYPGPLSEKQREAIKVRAARGVLVSEHEGIPKGEYFSGLLNDWMSNASHVELLTALLDLKGAKILEIRPRTGSILSALRSRHAAEVYALPIFESQQLIVTEVYGIPAVGLIDHESCAIPYETKFDLIICNHQLTHAVHPQRFFKQLQSKLTQNGSIYLYNEVDDEDILTGRKNLFRVLNPFHLQTFDGPSLVRALAANKFRIIFLTHIDGEFACLARLDPEVEMEPIPAVELDRRLMRYRQARDRAVLSADEHVKKRFESEWPTILSRALEQHVATVDHKGRVKVHR